MHVEGAVAGQVEDARGDPRAPVVRHDDVGLRLLEPGEQLFVVGAVADEHRDAVVVGEVGDRVAPDLLVRVLALRVRHDQNDIVFGLQQGLQGAVPPRLIAEHDDPHGVPPWSGDRFPNE